MLPGDPDGWQLLGAFQFNRLATPDQVGHRLQPMRIEVRGQVDDAINVPLMNGKPYDALRKKPA